MCARQRTYFSLLRQRKVGKRKATPLAVSLRFAAGNLRCSGMGRRCGTRFAPLALRSNSRSESEHEAWSCCAAHARPTPCASRHGQRGVGRTRAVASLGPETTDRARGQFWHPQKAAEQAKPATAVAGLVPASGGVPPRAAEGGRRVSGSGGCSYINLSRGEVIFLSAGWRDDATRRGMSVLPPFHWGASMPSKTWRRRSVQVLCSMR